LTGLRSGRWRCRRSSLLSRSLLHQLSNTISRLCTVVDPVRDAFQIQPDFFFFACRARIKKPNAFNEMFICSPALIGNDNRVKRSL